MKQDNLPVMPAPVHSTVARNFKESSLPDALAEFDRLPDSAFVGISVLTGLFSCGKSTIWARQKKDKLPQPRKFGKSTRWNVGQIRAVLSGDAK